MILNAWTPQNTDTDVPVLDGSQNANTFSDKYLIGADYFNLRNITLGYSLPSAWLRKAYLEKARVYVAAEKLSGAPHRQQVLLTVCYCIVSYRL